MGWASGFRAGSEAAQRAIDVYNKAKQEQELSDIKNAKPEAVEGYTAAQGQQLENAARAINPETGQPYYQIEAVPGTNQYRITAASEGAEPVVGTMAPQRVTDYLGRRYEGDLSPEQQERAQYRAMADVVAKQDPIAGSRLRMAISQDERAEKEFEQNTTLRGLQINDAQRKEGLLKEFDSKRDEIKGNVLKFQSAAESGNSETFLEVAKAQGADIRKTVDPKTGVMTLTLYENGKPIGSANSLTEAASKLGPMYMMREMEKYGPLFANNAAEFMTAVMAPRKERREEKESDAKVGLYGAQTEESKAKARQADATARYLDNNKGKDDPSDLNAQWSKIEADLVKQRATPKEVQAEKDAWFARRGFAPPAAQEVYRTGKMPDGKPLSPEDFAAIERRYPQTDFSKIGRPKAAAAPASKPGKPAAAIPTKEAPMDPAVEKVGVELDKARAVFREADESLKSYGLRQQKNDPAGFAAAKKQVEAARAALKEAEAKYQAALPSNAKSAFPR